MSLLPTKGNPLQYVYLLTVSSVHNEDDDGGTQDDGNPVHRVQAFWSVDTALLAAELVLAGTLDDEGFEGDDDAVKHYHEHESNPYNVRVTNWCTHTFITVDRVEVLDDVDVRDRTT